MRGVLAVLVGLALAITMASVPADAARSLNLRAQHAGGNTVVLWGKAPKANGKVVIQYKAGRHWKRAKRVKVHGHRFQVRVHQHPRKRTYRAVVGSRTSRVVQVQKKAPRPKPTATPTPTPTVDPTPTADLTPTPTPDPDPTPTPTPTPETDACGVRPAKPDGSLWACTFDDEFDGTSLDRTKWLPQTQFVTGTTQGYACYQDDPANVSVSDGNLHLTARKVDPPAPCAVTTYGTTSSYTSGMVSTYHLFSQQYGRFEARMKVTDTDLPGLQESFWLWPDDRVPSKVLWPAAGEIDIAEQYSNHPDLAIPFLHYTSYDNGGAVPGLNTAWNCTALRGVYNTYTLEWTAQSLTILVNGRTCLVNTSGDPAFQKPYIIALTQLLGATGNELTADTPLPATTDVDYVRVWN